MSNIEVLLNTEDVVVLGPPTFIDVAVDIGPTGVRGSQIFVGIGNPNSLPPTSFGQTPVLNDMYINASPGQNYGYMYQYISQPGGNTWVEVLRVNPTLYNENQLETFTSGISSINIPISDITSVDPSSLTAANFNVQCTFINEHPISYSITGISISGSTLVIGLEAIEYASGTWQPIDGDFTIHVFISLTA